MSQIFAIADLHLSFGTLNKSMERFGPVWKDWTEKLRAHWEAVVRSEDLVLIAGDVSWAMRPEEVLPDLLWIDQLPGTKVMIRGNHDFWWSSLSKIKKMLPKSIHVIQNQAFQFGPVSIAGSRLWDSSEYTFSSCIIQTGEKKITEEDVSLESEKIFLRELVRLELSLKQLNCASSLKLAMTHYPPISLDLKSSKASTLFENYGVQKVVFGHLHSVRKERPLFGKRAGVEYCLTSCDYLDFKPLLVATF